MFAFTPNFMAHTTATSPEQVKLASTVLAISNASAATDSGMIGVVTDIQNDSLAIGGKTIPFTALAGYDLRTVNGTTAEIFKYTPNILAIQCQANDEIAVQVDDTIQIYTVINVSFEGIRLVGSKGIVRFCEFGRVVLLARAGKPTVEVMREDTLESVA